MIGVTTEETTEAVSYRWRGRNWLNAVLAIGLTIGMVAIFVVEPWGAAAFLPAVLVLGGMFVIDPGCRVTIRADGITYRLPWRKRVFPRADIRGVALYPDAHEGAGEAFIVLREGKPVQLAGTILPSMEDVAAVLENRGYKVAWRESVFF